MQAVKTQTRFTPRESDIINPYFNDVRRIPLLSTEEEEEIAFRAQQGDEEAMNKLIIGNLRFAVSVANRFVGQGLSQADLIAYGNVGLIRAARTYEPNRGFKFTTYAVWHIKAAIRAAIEDEGCMVRIPSNRQQDLCRILSFVSRYEQEHELPPTTDEIAVATGLSADAVVSTLSLSRAHISLDAPMGEAGDYSMLDLLPSESVTDRCLEPDSRKSQISTVMAAALTDRQRAVIEMCFGLNGKRSMTYAEVGEELGISIERVRQVKNDALHKLRRQGGDCLRTLL